MTSGVVAIAETPEQAELGGTSIPAGYHRCFDGGRDAWREREARTDRTVEGLLDERRLGELGPVMTDVV